ncbi:MAG: hypothetical protein ACREDF_00035 [Thermoplasmata archaeon]
MPPGRVETLFRVARDYAALRVPWLKKAKFHICELADFQHTRAWRYFAHSGHLGVYTVCFATASEAELTDGEALGISAHEFGHLVAIKEHFPEHEFHLTRHPHVEEEANRIARRVLGFRGLKYNLRTLEEVKLKL